MTHRLRGSDRDEKQSQSERSKTANNNNEEAKRYKEPTAGFTSKHFYANYSGLNLRG